MADETPVRYWDDPLFRQTVALSGTPAAWALQSEVAPPGTPPMGVKESLSALAAWMGLAIPGLGGIGAPFGPLIRTWLEQGAASKFGGAYRPKPVPQRKPITVKPTAPDRTAMTELGGLTQDLHGTPFTDQTPEQRHAYFKMMEEYLKQPPSAAEQARWWDVFAR